jgi:uncharacterized protein
MNTIITKSFHVDQGISEVWANLNDPEKVVACVPGASLTEKIDDNTYKGAVDLKFGPVKASYGGTITFTKRDEAAHQMSLKGTGTDTKGKGGAEMNMTGTLSQKDTGTNVDISMDVSITGMLAQFGSRLINDVSNQVFDQFVNNFKSQLAGKEIDRTLSASSMVGGVVKGIFGGKKT